MFSKTTALVFLYAAVTVVIVVAAEDVGRFDVDEQLPQEPDFDNVDLQPKFLGWHRDQNGNGFRFSPGQNRYNSYNGGSYNGGGYPAPMGYPHAGTVMGPLKPRNSLKFNDPYYQQFRQQKQLLKSNPNYYQQKMARRNSKYGLVGGGGNGMGMGMGNSYYY